MLKASPYSLTRFALRTDPVSPLVKKKKREKKLVEPALTALLVRSGVLGPEVSVRLEPFPPALVLSNVRLWQWAVDLANQRFFFGPLCMPCDAVVCDQVRSRARIPPQKGGGWVGGAT